MSDTHFPEPTNAEMRNHPDYAIYRAAGYDDAGAMEIMFRSRWSWYEPLRLQMHKQRQTRAATVPAKEESPCNSR